MAETQAQTQTEAIPAAVPDKPARAPVARQQAETLPNVDLSRLEPLADAPEGMPALGGPNKGGHPFHDVTEQERRFVSTMAGYGFAQGKIAAVVGISEPTLRKHFRKELDVAEIQANALVAQALFKAAIGGKIDAQKFWLKVRGGWKERSVVEVMGPDGKPLTNNQTLVVELAIFEHETGEVIDGEATVIGEESL